MKNIFLGIILLAGFNGTAQQQVRQGNPKLTYKDTAYNFGVVKKGAEVEGVFLVTNTGDVPVVMRQVKPSCKAITVVSYPFKPIFPGQQKEIRVRFNSSIACADPKYVTVETSEKKSFRNLAIKAQVK